jgi:hypothetical protein
MFAGSISPKAAKKLNGKLKQLRGTRAQASKMAAFNSSQKDEGGTKKAEIPTNEINNATNQSKKGAVGSVSKGGGVSAGNPATGNTRMRGPIVKSGGPYGGGGRDTQ